MNEDKAGRQFEGERPVPTLVADDEALARSLLATLVRRDPGLVLVGESANGAAALEDIRRLEPALVLLDIQMPVMSGIEVAERLAAAPVSPHLIFVTAFDDYAIRAFELDVLDYLVKPVEKERFRASVTRAKAAIRRREMCRLTERIVRMSHAGENAVSAQTGSLEPIVVRNGDEIVSLNAQEIVWVEAANQYVTLHTGRGRFMMAESLGQFAARRAISRFIRIHRSAMVNGDYIEKVLRVEGGAHDVCLRSGVRLRLARSRRDLLPALLQLASGHAVTGARGGTA